MNTDETMMAGYKPGLRSMCEFLNGSLATLARAQEQQLEATRTLLAEIQSLGDSIEGAKNLQELVQIHAQFARASLGSTAAGMTNAFQAATRYQADAVAKAKEQLAKIGEDMSRATGTPSNQSPAALWQTMMNTYAGAYAASLKAAEDITRTAARGGKGGT